MSSNSSAVPAPSPMSPGSPGMPASPASSVFSGDELADLEVGPSSRLPRFNLPAGSRMPHSSRSMAGSSVDLNESVSSTLYAATGSAGMSQLNLGALGAPLSSAGPAGFNGISTVLNNPKKRANPITHSKHPLPPVPPTDIPRLRRKDFEAYLASVAPEYDRFVRNTRLGRGGQARLHATTGSHGGSVARPAAAEGEEDDSGQGKAPAKELPPLSDIPQVFFSEDFNLGNPFTFDAVTEQSPLKSDPTAPPSPNALPSQRPDFTLDLSLQEKLSHYADVAEQHLIREIGLRSSSFFAAVENLQDLQAEAAECLSKIAQLRTELRKVDDGQARKGMKIILRQAKRRERRRVSRAAKSVAELVERRDMIGELLAQGEYFDALELLEEVREAIKPPSERGGKQSVSDQRAGRTTGTIAEDEEGEIASRSSTDVRSLNGDKRTSSSLSVSSRNTLSTSATTATSAATTVSAASTLGQRKEEQEEELDLSALRALASIPPQLNAFSLTIASFFEQEMIAALVADIKDRVEAIPPQSIDHTDILPASPRANAAVPGAPQRMDVTHIKRSSISSTLYVPPTSPRPPLSPSSARNGSPTSPLDTSRPTIGERDERLRSRIFSLVEGLIRTGGLDAALRAYRDAALKEVKGVIKLHLPAYDQLETDEAAGGPKAERSVSEKSASLARTLRAMDHASFLRLAKETYAGLLRCVKAIEQHGKTISQILEQISGSSTLPFPASSLSSFSAELTGLVHAAAELGNMRASKVVGVRTDQHASLGLEDFLAIFNESWKFVIECEIICRRMLVGLRGTMVTQAKAFLASFHSNRVSSAAKAVEDDQWAQAEVPADAQHAVDLLVEAAVKDPQELLLDVDGRPTETRAVNGGGGKEEGGGAAKSSSKQLDIEDRSYFVVNATVHTLRLLVEYVKLVMNLPLLTTEAMSRVIEFMKAFNSRACQVVLGAGAMRSAGLKNITAKHLALASQSLSVMISLIPYVRETIRRHLNPKQAVMLVEFDKLKRDYQEHQYEIHAKLVMIMGDRLTIHCRSLRAVDWEDPNVRKGGAHSYMESIVKETATLHKVLSKYVGQQAFELVMGQVFEAVRLRLCDELKKIEVKSEEGKERMQQDVAYLKRKLAELKQLEFNSEELERIAANKVPTQPPPRRSGGAESRPSLSSSPRASKEAGAGTRGEEGAKARVQAVVQAEVESGAKAGEEAGGEAGAKAGGEAVAKAGGEAVGGEAENEAKAEVEVEAEAAAQNEEGAGEREVVGTQHQPEPPEPQEPPEPSEGGGGAVPSAASEV